MAPTFQASKFALLPDDDEDLNKKALRALKNGKTDSKVDNAKTKSKAKKKNKKKNSEATPPPDPSNGDSNKNEKKIQPETSSNNEQFSTWLSHDKQVNDEAFAQDLQNAILASKIEHVAESKKSQNGPPGMSKQNKKSATMTLQDFNNLSLNQDANSQPNSNLQTAVTETETFFEDVEEATKKALNREQIKESLEQRYNHLPDQALLKQYRSILESKDTEIVKLNNTNQMLTDEVEKVKKRYKVFRELLDQVECREKAEVVGENMKLKKVQAEISKELDLLREENEKLKTKVASNERMKILSDKLKERKAEQKTEKE
jgi:hypothetical protein